MSRLTKIPASLEEFNTQMALMAQDLSYIKNDVTEIKEKISKDYATKEWVNAEYGQTRKILNSILVTLGLAIVGALASFIIKGGLR